MNLYQPELFPQKLRELRQRHKMTQKQLAAELGVSTNAISCWETGRQEPDKGAYVSIAVFFGVTVDELFGRTDKQPGWEFTLLSPKEMAIIKLIRTKHYK